MAESPITQMVLVYDLRQDHNCRKLLFSNYDDQWQSFLRGESEVRLSEGVISKLFYAPYEGEHMFHINEGGCLGSWVRLGEESWYVVGRRVKVESVVFPRPHPILELTVVVRIWIGEEPAK